jgi:putative oxidoreductase
MKHVKLILFWIVGILFIATGILKLIHFDKMSIAIFDRARYPLWLFYAVALFELAGGILFIIKKTRQFGALMIGAVMLGAVWTHFYLNDDIAHMIAPTLIVLIAVSAIEKVKWKQK